MSRKPSVGRLAALLAMAAALIVANGCGASRNVRETLISRGKLNDGSKVVLTEVASHGTFENARRRLELRYGAGEREQVYEFDVSEVDPAMRFALRIDATARRAWVIDAAAGTPVVSADFALRRSWGVGEPQPAWAGEK